MRQKQTESKTVITVTRKEKKFLLNHVDALHLESVLSRALHSDPHNGATGYQVRSLYFDTLHSRDYVEKLLGFENRRKVRLRVYDPKSDKAYLELKQKQGDNQRKRTLPLNKSEATALTQGNAGFLMNRVEPFAQEMYGLMAINGYRPAAIVEYHRKAFLSPVNRVRVTLDSDIRATELSFDLFDSKLCLYPVFESSLTVLEVKFTEFLTSSVKSLLSCVDKSELSVSKYALSRSVCHAYQF